MKGKLLHLVVLLGNLSDRDVLELHRIVSRRATDIRRRDPVYIENQKMGLEASRAKRDAGLSELRGCLSCRITPNGMESERAVSSPSSPVVHLRGSDDGKTLCGITPGRTWHHPRIGQYARPP